MKEITRNEVSSLLPLRAPNANKGSFGRVLVVAGSRTMCGAGLLCAKSALVAGAGLVYWALPQSMQRSFAAALPEAITLPLAETEKGELALENVSFLSQFCHEKKISMGVLGPGMGTSPLIIPLLKQVNLPWVVDADALNALAAQADWLNGWDQTRPAIFTPHPGEMARLLQTGIAQTADLRQQQVETLARQTGAISILKGAGTLVASSQTGETVQNTTGNSSLAKAGAGDVLAGIIAGLWAQLGTEYGFTAKTAFHSAVCGVYLHGLAGDLAARHLSPYSVLARDIIAHLPAAFAASLREREDVCLPS